MATPTNRVEKFFDNKFFFDNYLQYPLLLDIVYCPKKHDLQTNYIAQYRALFGHKMISNDFFDFTIFAKSVHLSTFMIPQNKIC